jgi:hypothetical protein
VLMIGYEEQMKDMLREANPGLARRFQVRLHMYLAMIGFTTRVRTCSNLAEANAV